MDERLEAALEDLLKADDGMIEGDDPDDEFYSCASHLANVYRAMKKGEEAPDRPIQTGVKFSLMPDGSTRIQPC